MEFWRKEKNVEIGEIGYLITGDCEWKIGICSGNERYSKNINEWHTYNRA